MYVAEGIQFSRLSVGVPRICFAFAALEEWRVQPHWKFAWCNW